jgi:ubiquitin carboxyl-terminal hydrolase 4/11/15
LNGKYKKDLQPKEKGLAEQFTSLLKKIRSHQGKPSSSGESTYSLKRAIEKVSPTFSGYDQQDAQELLKAVLEGINEDCNRIDKKPQYRELKIDDKWSKQQNVI